MNVKTTVEAITALTAATERIAAVVERIERDDTANDKVSEILQLWDDWYNGCAEDGREAPDPLAVLSEIGKVLYRGIRDPAGER